MFRRYREGDERGIVELLKKCFRTFATWGITEEDWIFFEKTDYGFSRENALVAEENGNIVGHVHVVYRKLRIGSSYVDTGGIANVSTDPGMRGRGIARNLMKLALELTKERGLPLSSLLTGYGSAGYRVYRALGYSDTFFLYEFVGYRDRAEKALKRLRAVPDVEVDELELRDLDDAIRVHEAYTASLSASVWRPLSYWMDRIFQKTFYYSYFYDEPSAGIRLAARSGSKVVGYAIGFLQDRAKRPYWAPGTGAVLELTALNRDAARALLREMLKRMLSENVKVFRLFLPEDPDIVDALSVFERFTGAIYMDYILDQTKLFEQLLPELRKRLEDLGGVDSLSIDISSPYGCTRLVLKGYDISVESCGSGEIVEFDRDGIAKLIYGAIDLYTALREHAERIAISRKSLEVLQELFPKRRVYVPIIDQW